MPLGVFFLTRPGGLFTDEIWVLVGIFVDDMLVVIFDDISRNSTAFSVTRPAKAPSLPISAAVWLTDIGSLEDELSVRLCVPLLVAELEFSAAVTGKVSVVSQFVKTCTKSSKPPSKLWLMSSISPTDKIADTSYEESAYFHEIGLGMRRKRHFDR